MSNVLGSCLRVQIIIPLPHVDVGQNSMFLPEAKVFILLDIFVHNKQGIPRQKRQGEIQLDIATLLQCSAFFLLVLKFYELNPFDMRIELAIHASKKIIFLCGEDGGGLATESISLHKG